MLSLRGFAAASVFRKSRVKHFHVERDNRYMSSLSIDELRAFVAVFESGGFTLASKRLAITTNAVSLRIQKLEEALGIQLFVRTTRSVVPTDAARAFFERVSRVLDELEAAQDAVQAVDAKLRRTVRIAMPGAIATFAFFDHLRQLLQAHPKLQVHTRTNDAGTNISSGGSDVVLVFGAPSESSFVSMPLSKVTWVLAAAPRYLERHGTPSSPAELARQCCLPLPYGTDPYVWRLIDHNQTVVSVQVSGSYYADDGRAINAALYCGLGIGAIPLGECARAQNEGRLERVLPGLCLEPLDVVALIQPRKVGSPSIEACLDVLRAAVSEL